MIGKVLMGDHISLLEGGGALVALTGALFCSGDSADKAEAGTNTLSGDLYAMLSALAGVGYLVFAKQIRPAMELFSLHRVCHDAGTYRDDFLLVPGCSAFFVGFQCQSRRVWLDEFSSGPTPRRINDGSRM